MVTSPRPLRVVAALILALALAALVSACKRSGDDASAPGAEKVKLVLNWVPEPEFGGFYAAREAGAFKRAGFDVEIIGGGASVPVVQMVSTGQAAFGVVAGDEVVTARAHGADVIPLFATYQTPPVGIMAHASRGAKGIGDLLTSGKLAVDPGAPYVAFLKAKFGFDKVSVLPYDGGVARFLVEKDLSQQCYITSEPLSAKRKGGDPQVFLVADEGYAPYAAVLITRRALWQDKPALVRAFVRAVREGWRGYLDDPGPTNAVMGKLNSSMDAETFRDAAAAQRPLIEPAGTKKLGEMSRERWEKLGQQLADLKVVDKAPPTSEYVFPIDE